MDNNKRQNIMTFFLGGFIVPPLIWFLFGFYLNVFAFSRIGDINLILPVLYVLTNSTVFFFLNKYLTDIDMGLKKRDKNSIFQAQKSISYLPKFYLIALPIYGIILPLSSESDITVLFTFEYFLEWLLGLTLIFLTSTPFFILMLNSFEEAIEGVPLSLSHKDLDLDSKYFFISIPNIVGTFMVTVASYLLIFVKNEQNPDLIYVLFTKSIVLGIFILGIFGINYYLLRNQLLAPILKINDFMNNVILSGGNMNARLSMANRDEFASIANNFNRLMDFLKESVLQIDDTSVDMVNATKRLNQATKKHGYNTHKENETISEMKKTASQLKNVNELVMISTSKNLEILSRSHDLIGELNGRKNSLLLEMEQFNSEIRETLTSAQVGEKSLADMRHNMESLYMLYRDIEEVLDFTNDIAEKINLLSLNASIEAARAGELGIGFTVVAKQIATLSEDTKKSTLEIQRLVERSNDIMEKSSDQILSGVNTILTLLDGVQEIESDFGKILFNLKEDFEHYKVIENNQETVKTSEETVSGYSKSQNEKLHYITELISNIESFSKTNIESLKELSSTVEHNVHFAADLQKKITRFHLKVPGADTGAKPEQQVQKKTG